MTRSEFEHIAAHLHQIALKVSLAFFASPGRGQNYGSQEDAEDAAQETMVQLWRYCEHIEAERNVESLAYRIAKNCCVSIYRRRQNAVAIYPLPADQHTLLQQDHEASPQEQLEAKDTQRMLSEAIDLLKPRERQLFDMRAVMGLSTEEIAEQTGIPKPSVTSMVSAARKKVFSELKKKMSQRQTKTYSI